MFSVNKKSEISNLDSQINELCNYYKGTYESITANGLGSYGPIENGKVIKYFEMFYDIHTSTNDYHFSALWYIEDDYDSNNIGLWSMFIEEYAGDEAQTKTDSWDLGITIL